LSTAEPQTEPKRKSRRLYLVLAAAVLLITILSVAVFSGLFQTTYGIGPVDIEITPDKPFYLQGEEVNFTIYVYNPHDWPVAHPQSVLCIIEREGVYVDSLGGGLIDYASPFPTIAPHSEITYRESWNQKRDINGTHTQVEPGNYTLIVSLEGPSFDNSGNCTFEIR
jgi:hypothetical protein